MNKRTFKFIFALTALTVLIWGTGEFLIGYFINNYTVSVIWGIVCLVACLAYSLWKCPWDIGGMMRKKSNKLRRTCHVRKSVY